MSPTINKGAKVILNTSAYKKASDIARWDIVAFEIANYDGSKSIYIKRVIGLPGEKIEFTEKKVYINEIELNIPEYLKTNYTKFIYPISSNHYRICKIPPDEFFLIGDNIQNSRDSRYFGPFKYSEILGKIELPKRKFPSNR